MRGGLGGTIACRFSIVTQPRGEGVGFKLQIFGLNNCPTLMPSAPAADDVVAADAVAVWRLGLRVVGRFPIFVYSSQLTLLLLAPSIVCSNIYDRVLSSRSGHTLLTPTIIVAVFTVVDRRRARRRGPCAALGRMGESARNRNCIPAAILSARPQMPPMPTGRGASDAYRRDLLEMLRQLRPVRGVAHDLVRRALDAALPRCSLSRASPAGRDRRAQQGMHEKENAEEERRPERVEQGRARPGLGELTQHSKIAIGIPCRPGVVGCLSRSSWNVASTRPVRACSTLFAAALWTPPSSAFSSRASPAEHADHAQQGMHRKERRGRAASRARRTRSSTPRTGRVDTIFQDRDRHPMPAPGRHGRI